jgi:hypothetical protein
MTTGETCPIEDDHGAALAAMVKASMKGATPEEIAEDESLLTELDIIEFDKAVSEVWERLETAGYRVGGGDALPERTVSFGIGLTERLKHLKERAFLDIPIRDEEGSLFPGFGLRFDEETREPWMDYDGPLDDKFKEVVDSMVKLAKPGEE